MGSVSQLSPLERNEIRVLIISDAAPHRNGVGAYYADLIDDIAPYVDQAEIVSPEIIGDKWSGGWMLPLPGDKTQKFCLPNAFELQKKIQAYKPTVVVIPTPGLFGLVGAALAKRMAIPVIVGFHTWFEKLASLYWNRVQGGLTKTYFEWVNKALFKMSDRVLANSQEMVEIASRIQAPYVGLMGTPISQQLLRAPLAAVPKNVSSVLFVGRLAAEKNIETILNAAGELPHIQFTIAGDGPERESLLSKARGLANVRMPGWVPREKLTHLIDQHDALVLPSKVESFGTVAMEAMARQRIVIVSKACGITEWQDLCEGMLVIEPNQTLCSVIQQAETLSEFELYSHCTHARKSVLAHVQWNRELWLECLQSNNAFRLSRDLDHQPLIQRVARSVLRQ